MAVNNRTEAITKVDAQLVPTITAPILRDFLNDDLISSIVFEKDVIASQSVVAGAVTVDFSNKDTITLTTAVNISISFTNLENGAVKYIRLTKALTNTVSFAGATNVTNFQKYINNKVTSVTYAVYNKNGVILVLALSETIIEAVLADIVAADEYKFANAKSVNDYVSYYVDNYVGDYNDGIKKRYINIGDWNMDTDPLKLINFPVDLTYSTIISASCMIRNNIDDARYPLHTIYSGAAIVQGIIVDDDEGAFRVSRLNGSIFDSTNFNSTSYNRGWIVIEYI